MTAIGYRSLVAKAKTLAEGADEASAKAPSGTVADPALIFDRHVAVFWTHWFARVEEARAHLAAEGGTLLPYRTQFVVVGPDLLAAVGLDPHDPDWDRIGRDWTDPKAPDAFERLNAMLVAAGFGAETTFGEGVGHAR
jgi:hypothetical protein